MRSKGIWNAVFMPAALCVLFAQTVIGAEKVYVNGIDANFPPFSYVDQSNNPDGFDVKALDWIAKEMGFKVKHQPVDWDGIVTSLRSKKIDIVASGMGITDELKKQISFTMAYWKIKHVLVAKKDTKITVEKALAEGNKIGVQRGTKEGRWIEENLIRKAGKKFELVYYDSVPLAIEELVDGRIIAAAMEDAPALSAAIKNPVKIIGGFGMSDREFGYAVRKEDTEFLKKLNEGLKRLMKSIYWEELRKTYIDK
ncbi:MAG TPA: amino acid ABC transporter substrate-binding protein [Syntrophus sp. (in: bacteria)]|nr:MAG: amino acid ABC transporter substrate-binding protein [Syntrophus sp. GWC2_56_31]HBB17701.1 amino acid ABC transporter substrate-binding protein [Syntrophus sp. (in: bacteria)]